MAIGIKGLKFPEDSDMMHRFYGHTSFGWGIDEAPKPIKETPLLRWYRCRECGEYWKEHKYDTGEQAW